MKTVIKAAAAAIACASLIAFGGVSATAEPSGVTYWAGYDTGRPMPTTVEEHGAGDGTATVQSLAGTGPLGGTVALEIHGYCTAFAAQGGWRDQLAVYTYDRNTDTRVRADITDVVIGGDGPGTYRGTALVKIQYVTNRVVLVANPYAAACFGILVGNAPVGFTAALGTVTGVVPVTVLPAVFTDSSFGALQVGVPASDGVAADRAGSYRIVGGTLPAGLVFADDGSLTGTPTVAGPYDVTIAATNQAGDVEVHVIGDILPAATASPGNGSNGGTETGRTGLEVKLDLKVGAVVSGAAVKVSAEGLRAGTGWALTVHSTPQQIGSGTVGANGLLAEAVALPANLDAGSHRLVLTATAADGTAVTDEAWFAVAADGTLAAISYDGPVSLAATGAKLASTGFTGGAVLPVTLIALLAGLALIAIQRHRARRA